jgi:membrane peptidoglycan carboxypeptidase
LGVSVHRIRLWRVVLVLAVGASLALLSGVALTSRLAGPPQDGAALTPSILITDREGRVLFEVIDPKGSKHIPIPLADIPPACRQATIATEDRRFYSHPGVDVVAILRAAWGNWQLRRSANPSIAVFSGASTLTQQLARNLYLAPEERYERSFSRKLREAWLAWNLERRHSKDEILALYLNSTYYGHFASGIEAASQAYFGVDANELDLAQCALLAGLPQNPVGYNPIEYPEAARGRQGLVLDLMARDGYITPQQAKEARGERLAYASTPFPIEAPHFVMWVEGQVEDLVGAEAFHKGGLKVTTTLDLDVQRRAEEIVRRRLARLRPCASATVRDTTCDAAADPSRRVENAALISMDPDTGAVLAMVGSPDYFDPRISGAVNGALSARQPGSAIKPITYAVALDPEQAESAGKPPWTAATLIADLRTVFPTREGQPYVPLNYDRQFHGPVSVRSALANSYNIPAVKTLQYIGVDALVEQASRMGIDWKLEAGTWKPEAGSGESEAGEGVEKGSETPEATGEAMRISSEGSGSGYGLALTLGGGEVRLLDLTAAYGAFANGGHRVRANGISRIETLDGGILFAAQDSGKSERVLDPRVAYLITDILSDEAARRPAFGEGNVLEIGRPAAAKTGTTTDWRDNWTVGYVAHLVTGVWVGNADNTPMRDVSGITGAGPIWHDFMTDVLREEPAEQFPKPGGLIQVEVCGDSGLLPGDSGSGQVQPASARRGSGNSNLRAQIEAWQSRVVSCPYRRLEWFITGTEPVEADAAHREIAIDVRTGRQADSSTPEDAIRFQTSWVLPYEYREWAQENGIAQPLAAAAATNEDDGRDVVSGGAATAAGGEPIGGMAIHLTSPDDNRVYRLDPRLPAEAQRIAVTAVPGFELAAYDPPVTLYLDGIRLASVEGPDYTSWWQLQAGRHTFQGVAIRPDGQIVSSDFVTVQVQ